MLVVPRDGEATLVIPRLEAPRVVEQPGRVHAAPVERDRRPGGHRRRARRPADAWPPWATRCGRASWSSCSATGPPTAPRFVRSTTVMNDLRMRKDAAEIAALQAAGAAADRVAAQLHAGDIPLAGPHRGSRSAPTSRRACSPRGTTSSTSPSWPPARTRPRRTTTPATGSSARASSCCATSAARWPATAATSPAACTLGTPPAEVAEAYAVLHAAQAAGVAAGVVGAACQDVDRASRRVIADAGWGEYFIHRTGHGIGMEAHEDPYMVEGNALPIAAGSRVQRRARHLRAGQVGHAPGGHRGGHRRRTRCR